MRTDRPYRSAMSFEAAAEQMIVNTGSQFDPAVVEVMLPVVAAAEGSEAARHDTAADTVTVSADELATAAAQLAVPATN